MPLVNQFAVPGCGPSRSPSRLRLFMVSFANGVAADTAYLLYATQRPITLNAGNQPSGRAAWKLIPSWYLVGTQAAECGGAGRAPIHDLPPG